MTSAKQQAAYEMESVKIMVEESKKGGKGESRSYICGLIKLGPDETLVWRIFQILMWFVLVATITAAPVMMRMSHVTASGQQAKMKYVPATVHTISFVMSIFIGIALTALLQGKDGVREIFRPRSLLWLSPVSVGYSISEALALFAMTVADPVMYAVIHKIRLLETALLTRIFLRRHVSLVQWMVCFTVTACVMAFVVRKAEDDKGKASSDDSTHRIMGPLLLLLNISVSVCCAIMADYIYKLLGYSLSIQMACGRITGALGSAVIAIIQISVQGTWSKGWFGGHDGGWDGRVVALLFFFVARDWINCFVLLYQDALWKALAGSAAVATTYIADWLINKKAFSLSQFCLVCTIMLAVSVYALVKVNEKEVAKVRSDLKELQKKAALAGNHDSPLSDKTTV